MEAKKGEECQESAERKVRKMEWNTLVVDMMKETAMKLCSEQKKAFNDCCKENGILMTFSCRKESQALKSCINGYYNDPEFVKEHETKYLMKKSQEQKPKN
ncbi:COX assembly mitochondrial protein homolog [Pogona vitticeps]|uniref:COX assembly mitochondrial protein n=1 Tax=Pogona vitticeps TaxID=103695 RepID=A0ABM5GPH1_9SAUR|nr:COX assembly mitochondrial protein homolog isoform X1 [Pogona vitticeps]